MDISMTWLRDYVNVKANIKDFVEDITLSGSKVESYSIISGDIKKVVVGKVLSIEKHPNADKLVITKVDIGNGEPIQIVTGATNLYVGAIVPVALNGSTIANGVKIKKGKLRGEESNGMLCSIRELGFDRHDFPEAPENGIYIFKDTPELGTNVVDALDIYDEAVEFEITSNRPDCFSMLGLARETGATYRIPVKYPIVKVKEEIDEDINNMISVEIKNPNLCPRYVARVVKDVKIAPSPRWMRKRLRSVGIRPINNIVDITNFVMQEYGQPMHAFSIDTIADRKIIVRNAEEGEKFTTLDGIERTLSSSMLVISDPKKAVAIAGVMGGENSMITGDTDTVLFESANFDGPNTRITAKKLGLRTDASGKYEKGLDPNICDKAIDRAVQLVEMLGCGKVVRGRVDCYPNKVEPRKIPYNPKKINKLLGTDIPEEDMVRIFKLLEIGVDKKNRILTIPTFRPDLELNADLAEEVARIHGYDKIMPTLASGTPTVGKKTYEQQISDIVKNSMISTGLCEAMTYTFESPKVFDKLLIPSDSKLRDAIKISNPLGEDFSIMRTTTLNGMLTSISTNYNRRNDEAAIFEIGKVFIPKSLPLTELPDELKKLTICMYGDKYNFFYIKGICEHIFDVLGCSDEVDFSPKNDIPWMHPGRTASVTLNGSEAGYVGELHPTVAENYSIDTRVYIAVIDMKLLNENACLVNSYRALPKYPSMTRDISMVIKKEIFVKDIEKVIRKNAGKLLESLVLFDVYQGAQIESDKKSVSYKLVFRAEDRTLVDDEVNKAMEKVIEALKNEFGAKLRK
ncbi:MAG: phenylalanine--tRNA ligase subunit beta [Clostridia bacterium]|jgi:phenylalanyl-tRNA synthetase beta chain|nr:phenylalanine--tRNA ligase subunit beta [Clostridia bacterium]